MATKFFIGGNEFYDSEEEATAELIKFEAEHEIPHDTFVIVRIVQQDPGGISETLAKDSTLH